jgi:hypothetical protein
LSVVYSLALSVHCLYALRASLSVCLSVCARGRQISFRLDSAFYICLKFSFLLQVEETVPFPSEKSQCHDLHANHIHYYYFFHYHDLPPLKFTENYLFFVQIPMQKEKQI